MHSTVIDKIVCDQAKTQIRMHSLCFYELHGSRKQLKCLEQLYFRRCIRELKNKSR